MIPAPVATAWIVHSRNGITALAWPVDPPTKSEAAPVAPGAAPDPKKGITSK